MATIGSLGTSQTDPPSPHSEVWIKLQEYTKYTKSFVSILREEHLGARIDDTCYAFLFQRPGFQLFPRLRYLDMQEAPGFNCRWFLNELLCKRNVSRASIVAGDKIQLDNVCTQLASCAAQRLKTLVLFLSPELELPSTLFKCIGRFVNLEELEIAYSEPLRHDSDDMPPLISRIPVQVFSPEPLLKLSKITRFVLRGPFSVNFASLEQIAQAWPRLHSLELRTQARYYGTPIPYDFTVRDLVPLVVHCKNLVELAVCLRTTLTISEETPKHISDAVGDGLQDLKLFSSVGIYPTLLNSPDHKLLLQMFPRAEIRGAGTIDPEDVEAQMWVLFPALVMPPHGLPLQDAGDLAMEDLEQEVAENND